MAVTPFDQPYLYILVAGALVSDVWRWLGVIVAGRVREDSEILEWVRAVAGALIAGVIARLILFPNGALAETEMWLRILAVGVGFAGFLLIRRSVLAGVILAETVLLIGIGL
ncbi:AzlD domain-containing protein [Coralliovum pocilloporae]|uniref:AzlD domain-containing protein n=1 Tax=Coralliovum pocilloporae TaxID=3066369 RepID=UPI003D9C67D7